MTSLTWSRTRSIYSHLERLSGLSVTLDLEDASAGKEGRSIELRASEPILHTGNPANPYSVPGQHSLMLFTDSEGRVDLDGKVVLTWGFAGKTINILAIYYEDGTTAATWIRVGHRGQIVDAVESRSTARYPLAIEPTPITGLFYREVDHDDNVLEHHPFTFYCGANWSPMTDVAPQVLDGVTDGDGFGSLEGMRFVGDGSFWIGANPGVVL